MKNTHIHPEYGIKILDVFEVNRHGENKDAASSQA